MAIEYVNRKGHRYFLHEGKTKTGKTKYYFSKKKKGTLADAIPEGYEIYEHPNAQVYLRKVGPKIITDDEIATVERAMQRFYGSPHYKLDVKGNTLEVFLPNQDVDSLSRLSTLLGIPRGRETSGTGLDFSGFLTYSAELRFILADKEKREFKVQRYSYRVSYEGWIDMGERGELALLAEKYVKQLR